MAKMGIGWLRRPSWLMRVISKQLEQRLALIQPTLTYDAVREADIIVEAVFEGMELKKQVFAELDAVDVAVCGCV